jgi:hypothetical protein
MAQYTKNGPAKRQTNKTHGSDYSTKNRNKSGDYSLTKAIENFGAPKPQRRDSGYGQGKHSKGGKKKQFHW